MANAKKRPVIIIILCIIGWIMVVLNFMEAFSPAVKKIGQLYPALYSLVVCFQFIAFVGIWYMKRWGVELFIITVFTKAILFVFMNTFSFTGIGFILSVIMMVTLLFFYRGMDRNL